MAVYTEVSFEELEQFLRSYDIGAPLSFKGIAEGIENSNYYLQTDRGAFILTLYEKRVDPADLPFFLGLMEHLARRGIVCPQPVPTRAGALWTMLNGRHCAIVTFLTGLSLRRPGVAACAAAGEMLARLHLAGADFGPGRINALGPAGWRPLAAACQEGADSIEEGLGELIGGTLAGVEQEWPSLPAGIIHADLFPDNVLFMNEKVSGVIDFYFACNDMLAYDLAVTLNSWCFELDGSYNITKGKALAAGYRGTRALSDVEMAALPVLMRGAALRFLLTRLYDYLHHDTAAPVRPKDPREYARKLRFHRRAKSPQDYGL